MLWAKADCFYAHIVFETRKTRRTQKSTLLLLPVPDNSASQLYLSSCDAQCLSSLFLNEFTEGPATTENGRPEFSTVPHKIYGVIQLLTL